MARVKSHKRGRPARRVRMGRYFDKAVRVRKVRVLLNRPHRKRRRSRRSNPLSIIGMAGLNPRRHRRSRNRKHSYRKHSSRRRNAVGTMSLGGLSVGSLAPQVLTGVIAGLVTKLVPGFLGSSVLGNQMYRYGAQALTGIGGYFLLNKTVGKSHAYTWALVSFVIIGLDLAQSYLLSAVATPVATTGTSGLGYVNANYMKGQYSYPGFPGGVGAFTQQRIPGNISGVGAFVDPYHG